METEEQVRDIRAKVRTFREVCRLFSRRRGKPENNRLSEGGIREHPRYLYDSLREADIRIRNEGEFTIFQQRYAPPR